MKRFVLFAAVLSVLPTAALAITVQPGVEFYYCEPGLSTFEFGGPTTIPQGFFGPGSEPFVGTVAFAGQVILTQAGCTGDIGLAHVILGRTEPADLPFPGTTDQVPLQVVGFSLLSISPIEVSFQGGINEAWKISWENSPDASGETALQLFTFLSETLIYRNDEIPSRPYLVFERLSDLARREIDASDVQWDAFADVFVAPGVPWRQTGDLGEVVQPDCAGNFVGSYDGDPIVTVYQGQHGKLVMRPAPPSQPIATQPATWGAIKLMYR